MKHESLLPDSDLQTGRNGRLSEPAATAGDWEQQDASSNRAVINRANARHSTGPRTEAGKERARFNALRHGLTGHVVVLPSEDLAAYQRHSRQFLDDLQPKGALEAQLVQTLIDTSWRLNRIPALETNYLTLGIEQNLENIRADHPEARAALAAARALDRQSRALANLSIYEQRLSRQFERALQQLRQIQAERREAESAQMRDAARLMKMHAKTHGAQKIPYDPSQDGFVFSSGEIETFIARNDRLHRSYSVAS